MQFFFPFLCNFLYTLFQFIKSSYFFFSTSRLGWLIRFISHSVISGFTTASAVVIALSQAKYFLGYEIERSSKIIPLAESIIQGADKVCSHYVLQPLLGKNSVLLSVYPCKT